MSASFDQTVRSLRAKLRTVPGFSLHPPANLLPAPVQFGDPLDYEQARLAAAHAAAVRLGRADLAHQIQEDFLALSIERDERDAMLSADLERSEAEREAFHAGR